MIYHLTSKSEWQTAVSNGETYYPPTYEQDGFTHGTADANKLIEVANHFYQDQPGEWVCLAMTEDSLAKTGVLVKCEPAANVGDKEGSIGNDEEGPLFPHLFGGIHPDAVIDLHPVVRTDAGEFISISLGESLQLK